MATRASSLADDYEAFLLDLDGVAYRGAAPIPGAAEAIRDLRRRGRRVVFITNNSARTPEAVAGTLELMGVPASPDDVVTSAQAAVPLVRDLIGSEGTVFAVGEEGVLAALKEGGMTVLQGEPERADAVVVGWDRRADYEKLRVASVLVQRGARLVATNADASYPAPGGELWPGTGALLAVIEETTGRTATVAGKPHTPLFDAAVERVGTSNALVIGDRLETDVAGAAAAGLDAALVLTGAATLPDLLDHDALPVAIIEDLSQLFVERPHVRVRSATPGDEDAIRALVKEAALAETDRGGSESDGSAVVAEADDAPVATAGVRTQNKDAYLHSVVVRPGEQGLGLGTLIVAAAMGAARRQGASRCFLLTETASGFFSKLGFEPTDRDGMPAWILELSRDCAISSASMSRRLVQ
ncbi:MAG TPA: HAD-IIA family hydrolase [Actinomycetota bacterium]|nr:HAD-IIA family hydrolase [Actinomycetota bacterium]